MAIGESNSAGYEHLIVPQNWADFTKTDHGTWQILYERQMELIAPHVCSEYLVSLDRLGFSAKQIPNLQELNDRLRPLTGWEIVTTEGLVKGKPFFAMLADRKFPTGNFIRDRSELFYISEPDLVHDLLGHAPLFSNPAYANYMHEYGKGGERAIKYKTTKHLARCNWWSIEYGVLREGDEIKFYGAGLCSSYGEADYFINDPSAHIIEFDLERAMRTRVYICDLQPIYMCIPSFEWLFEAAVNTDFSPMYERFKGLGDHEQAEEYLPFDLQPGDEVIREGTQEYINPKREELTASLSI